MNKAGCRPLSLVLLVSFLVGCSNFGGASPTPTPTIKPAAARVLSRVKPGERLLAEAQVVPNRSASLTFNSGGVVDKVLAAEGEKVKAGDLMAELKGKERLEANIASAEMGLISAKQAVKALNDNAGLKQAQAKLEVATADKEYDDAQENLQNRKKITGTDGAIGVAYAEYLIAQNDFDAVNADYKGVENLPENDKDRAEVVTRLTLARDHLRQAYAKWYTLKTSSDKYKIGEAEAGQGSSKAKLEKAQKDLARLANGIDPEELLQAQARLKNAETMLEAARQAYQDIEMRAPFDGTIVVSNLKAGQFIAPKSPAVIMVDDSSWQIETTDLTEININGLKKGMHVAVTFDAISGLELDGKVDRIKEFGVNKQGDITYTIVVQTDRWDNRLKWNMSASAAFHDENELPGGS